MTNRLDTLLSDIRQLENEILTELEKKKDQFSYEIVRRTIHFRDDVLAHHKAQATHVLKYLRQARLRNVLTTPLIWLNIVPALLMDAIASIFQFTCFPIYKIPRVRRRDYIVIDRHYLRYLNVIEKINCVYCGYFNGVMAYVQEIAARTEQYWCPIKHANQLKFAHSRYPQFADFGDSDKYRDRFQEIRNRFDDIDSG